MMPDERLSILLAIRPIHAEDILCGRKIFEFRRVMPVRMPRRVVLYSSHGVGKIVGEFEVARVIGDTLDEVWKQASAYAGITRRQFDEYFAGLEVANAFEVFAPKRYANPVDPRVFAESRGLRFVPPQSFAYLPMHGLESMLEGVS